jgi:alpha-glucosidase
VLSNHDVTRTVTRYARSQPHHLIGTEWERARWSTEVPDRALGLRRARAAALMQLALPGTAYVYQGEELGLEEVEDLPDEVRQDPIWEQSGHTDVGRDGCRVPLPWSGDVAPFGFSPKSEARTWLPQPPDWASRTAEAQDDDPDSTLNLYREALSARSTVWVDAGALEWIETAPEVAAFRRGDSQCWVNTGKVAVDLPTDAKVVLASVPGTTTALPPDASAWLVSSTS